jgi:hypothetical protein
MLSLCFMPLVFCISRDPTGLVPTRSRSRRATSEYSSVGADATADDDGAPQQQGRP